MSRLGNIIRRVFGRPCSVSVSPRGAALARPCDRAAIERATATDRRAEPAVPPRVAMCRFEGIRFVRCELCTTAAERPADVPATIARLERANRGCVAAMVTASEFCALRSLGRLHGQWRYVRDVFKGSPQAARRVRDMLVYNATLSGHTGDIRELSLAGVVFTDTEAAELHRAIARPSGRHPSYRAPPPRRLTAFPTASARRLRTHPRVARARSSAPGVPPSLYRRLVRS